jgi:excisionase family DNA binding protein
LKSRHNRSRPPALAKTREAASFLRCSEPCIREMIRTGKLHAVLVGRGYRIPRESIEGFLVGNGHRESATP